MNKTVQVDTCVRLKMLNVDINFHRSGLKKQCRMAKRINCKYQIDIRGVFAFKLGKGGKHKHEYRKIRP